MLSAVVYDYPKAVKDALPQLLPQWITKNKELARARDGRTVTFGGILQVPDTPAVEVVIKEFASAAEDEYVEERDGTSLLLSKPGIALFVVTCYGAVDAQRWLVARRMWSDVERVCEDGWWLRKPLTPVHIFRSVRPSPHIAYLSPAMLQTVMGCRSLSRADGCANAGHLPCRHK
jgi:hypothetical protein